MNNSDFGQDETGWSLKEQFALMCEYLNYTSRLECHLTYPHPEVPISFGVIVISLVLAFFGFLRAFIWSSYNYIITWVAVRTGLYSLWLGFCGRDISALSLMHKTADQVHELKEGVRRARRRKKAEEIRKRLQDEAETKRKKEAEEAETAKGGRVEDPPPNANGVATGWCSPRDWLRKRPRGRQQPLDAAVESEQELVNPTVPQQTGNPDAPSREHLGSRLVSRMLGRETENRGQKAEDQC